MYERFFGLERPPFAMVPDADCVHVTGQHADVISGAVYGLLDRKGFLLLTGEAGLGKTTTLRATLALLTESQARASLVIHPTLDAGEFLELVLMNFGLSPVPSSKAQRLRMLEEFLEKCALEGRVCALIVDEAHKLPPPALEEIRLLGNLEANGQKLLQIMLAGQNELVDRLNLPELWQLKQRVALRLTLERLDRGGVEQYVRFRWNRAGGKRFPFDDAALDGIARWSLGIPRVVNAICDNALLVAFSATKHQVGLEEVREACRDLDLPTPPLPQRAPASSAGPLAAPPPTTAAPANLGPQPVPKPPADSRPATPEPELPSPPEAGFSWGEQRPSLLRRWLGLAGEEQQPPASTPKEGAGKGEGLSLKRHL